jgi:uncharacterized damage-inducible protein DinB
MLGDTGGRLMNSLLLLLRHKTWATLRLLEHCQALDDDQLRLTIPGTYGTILDTLRHVVGADEDYFTVLTGEQPAEWFLAETWDTVSLDDFVMSTRRRGPGWEAVAEDRDIQRRPAVFPDGIGWPGAVLVAQALHHADDHRTQICSILGAHGLEVPRLDVWAYARSADLQL